MSSPPDGGDERAQWAARLRQQAQACGELGSELYERLLTLIAAEVAAGASSWDVLRSAVGLRFGQAGPLRLLGAAHRLALTGEAPNWAAVMPSCGGQVPATDEALLVSWRALVDMHRDALVAGLRREVQTNEVGRAAGLALGLAECRLRETRLVELGCSGGLNLRPDRFEIDLGGVVLGDSGSALRLRPELTGELGGLRHDGLVLPQVTERVGIDPHPVDPTTASGAATLRSFVWPDQPERLDRLDAAISLARSHPAELLTSADSLDPRPTAGDQTRNTSSDQPRNTSEVLADVLGRPGATVVMHSIVWQYIPTDVRWEITTVIEEAGRSSSAVEPLCWIRYEPDEWDRRRAAIWCRSFPGGSDRLVAHADYHGRWVAPI